MGMPKQLKLVGNNLSNAASAFFIAYLIAEIPNGAWQESYRGGLIRGERWIGWSNVFIY